MKWDLSSNLFLQVCGVEIQENSINSSFYSTENEDAALVDEAHVPSSLNIKEENVTLD